VLFAGADGRDQSYYGYVGVRHHFSRYLTEDGFLLHALGIYGKYDYTTAAVVGGKVDGEVAAFSLMGGYQKRLDGLFLRGYAGLDYEDHDLSPNNTSDSNRGGDVGVKFQAEVETDYISTYYAGLIASYGTAKERYWARLRGGYNHDGYIFGPEALLTGNGESDEQRIGVFLTVTKIGPVGLSVSSGYSKLDDNRGGKSIYGTLELSTVF